MLVRIKTVGNAFRVGADTERTRPEAVTLSYMSAQPLQTQAKQDAYAGLVATTSFACAINTRRQRRLVCSSLRVLHGDG